MPAYAEEMVMKCDGYEDRQEMLEPPSVSDLLRRKLVEDVNVTIDFSDGSSIEVGGHPQFAGKYDYFRHFERFGVHTYAYGHRATGRFVKIEAEGDIKISGMSIEVIDCGTLGTECQYNLHMKGRCESIN